jgi:hypothetical protein
LRAFFARTLDDATASLAVGRGAQRKTGATLK